MVYCKKNKWNEENSEMQNKISPALTTDRRITIGIDVGGSTTKIVGFYNKDGQRLLIGEPLFVRATDPVTSIYGAFGRFTAENDLDLQDIDRVMMTGVGSSHISKPIYGLSCSPVSEFRSIGLGGLYLSGLDDAIIVSMGTGSALIHAKTGVNGTEIEYLGGTGVGGGTLTGLTKRLTGVDTIEHIEQLCLGGDLSNVDLRIKDMYKGKPHDINAELTASNFGKLSDMATNSDIALGVSNMVGETVAMMAIFAARGFGLNKIVLTGNLTTLSPIRDVFRGLTEQKLFNAEFIIPDHAQFATVIGAALQG